MRRLYKTLKDLLTLIWHAPLLWRMIKAKKAGHKIIVYHLASAGQFQYLLPYHKAFLTTEQPLAFFVSMDYPIHAHLAQLDIPKNHGFPSSIAKYLFPVDAFLETEIDGRGPKQALKIFTGHGHMHKYSHWAPDSLKAFDYYFLHSPLERQMFELIQSNSPAAQHIQLINVGYPKLDDLVNNRYSRHEILTQLKLDPKLKTVIYAPSWDPGGSLRTYGIEIAEKLLTIPNINVLVKLHPISLEPQHSPHFEFYTGGKLWETEFAKLANHPRFKFIKDYFINPYLFISDLMVNDYSGVGLEYMVLDRPIVYLECPEYYEKTLPSWQSDGAMAKNDVRFNGGRNAGTIVNTLDELKAQVEFELQTPQLNAAKRAQMTAMLMYNPGKGAEVGTQVILDLLANS